MTPPLRLIVLAVVCWLIPLILFPAWNSYKYMYTIQSAAQPLRQNSPGSSVHRPACTATSSSRTSFSSLIRSSSPIFFSSLPQRAERSASTNLAMSDCVLVSGTSESLRANAETNPVPAEPKQKCRYRSFCSVGSTQVLYLRSPRDQSWHPRPCPVRRPQKNQNRLSLKSHRLGYAEH